MSEVEGPTDFLSGSGGDVSGIRASTRAFARDAIADAIVIGRRQRHRLRRAALSSPRRRVLALGVVRQDSPNLMAAAAEELRRTCHELELRIAPTGGKGKFENLNELLAAHPARGHDWLLVIDDDVSLPRNFLDSFIYLAERFEFKLAQPAHRQGSNAAWKVTRRRAGAVARETRFVEIGPVFAARASTFDVLLPFPDLKVGWGLDMHWGALARTHGWRVGVIDATPILHGLRSIATAYDRNDAVEEARRFLEGKPYIKAHEAQSTLVIHRSW